jgi:hypothetical protein
MQKSVKTVANGYSSSFGDNSVVATTHGFIEDDDGERVVAVVVEDEEVPGFDLVHAAEPLPTACEVHHARAVEDFSFFLHKKTNVESKIEIFSFSFSNPRLSDFL